MAGQATSLGVLAAIANEHRAALIRVQGAMPLVQSAQSLGQGSLPLLARQLVLPPKTATNQLALPPPPTVTETATATATATTVSVGKLAGSEVTACASATSKHTRKDVSLVKPSVAPQKPVKPTPKKYLVDLFAELDIGDAKMPKRFMNGDFVKPDDEECQSYNDAARLVRTNELEKLRVLHQEGKNLDACNRVGESLLHLACRRGHVEVAEFLMNEAKVRWDLQDDFGRTILHDACWRPSPSIELMETLLKVVSPEWLLAQDIRGHTPFDYARREHATTWYDYLKKKEDMLKQRLSLLT